MSSKKHPGSLHLSLETDKEFQDRLRVSHGVWYYYHSGEALDNAAWSNFKIQRRLVEREAR